MNITKNKVFFGILIFGLITNLLVFFDIQYFYLRAIFSFIFLITTPGLVIMLMLKIRGIGFWQYFIYTIGLSVTFLMFGGLLINWFLPLIGIDKPLSLTPLLISFNILLFIFLIIAYIRNKLFSLEIKLPKLDNLNKTLSIIPIIFPILSILGTNTLNNQGPNYLSMIMLGGIAVYIFFIVLFRNKLNDSIYPWIILIISISLLLMFSLRSLHISGWDIHQEYKMFQLTKENFHWSMLNSPGEPYNSCLSITILPTILFSYLNINDDYIFKIFFQIIFSIVPVMIFLFLKRYTKGVNAFIASFFFLSKPEFIMGMPALARQEISIFYFVLFLVALFEKNFNSFIQKMLLVIIGFSMIVSHYSTSYVALLLFTFVYLIWLFFRKTENKKIFSKIYQKLNLKKIGVSKREKYHLGGILILLLFAFNFLWSFQITGTSGNLIDVFKLTTSNIGKIFTSEMKNPEALAALGVFEKTNTIEDIKTYSNNISNEYRSNKTWISFYNPDKYKDYTIEPRYQKNVPFTNIKVKTTSEFLTTIFNRLLQLFMLIGVFYLLFFQLKKQEIHEEYIIMSLGCVFLMIAIIFVPYLSFAYNFERLFQQCLIVLSLPAVLGILVVFKFLKNKNILYLPMVIIFIWIFLSSSGFNSNVFGGNPPMTLNNFGEGYDRFYTHDSEVKSLEWLSKYRNHEDEIYLDEYTSLKANSHSSINRDNILKDILPSTIGINAYVYSSYVNTIDKRTFVYYELNLLSYSFPTEFLNNNKSKVYNNGSSEIFK